MGTTARPPTALARTLDESKGLAAKADASIEADGFCQIREYTPPIIQKELELSDGPLRKIGGGLRPPEA
jgi:hypothetical protein